jgi:hypothetical protein
MTDRYTKTVLTIIAICLVALIFMKFEPRVTAQSSVTCTSDLTANAFGGTESLVGGYRVSLRCR